MPNSEDAGSPAVTGIRLRPMVHVQEMSSSVAFYERLGAHVVHGSRDGDWALLELAGTRFGLLAHPPNPQQDEGRVELNFQADQPLHEVEDHLRAAGLTPTQPVTDTGFGRQLQLTTPDGLLIKIDELQPDRFT
ncbi:VOC family protein [Amycolatopsis sp. PS_44_ISF1]|uniref:VOC family protein n=1 Tax=Amycolatopsis sp. PS_44_ISF1 TaxID=2974917 RepID=UPI0028DDC790|nr:VOC family protein [Amycolatopsis sp. PS_44_ISF1]MDT8914985.1 VOC family protein [Amycolatopsis sp. PS_44_ISF1]